MTLVYLNSKKVGIMWLLQHVQKYRVILLIYNKSQHVHRALNIVKNHLKFIK